METDGITELDVAECILNATAIYKVIQSQNPLFKKNREYLYVIQGTNLEGLFIYTKGKFVGETGNESYYFLIIIQKGDLNYD